MSTSADLEVTRYLINMETGEVKTKTFENFINNKYVNKFGNTITDHTFKASSEVYNLN